MELYRERIRLTCGIADTRRISTTKLFFPDAVPSGKVRNIEMTVTLR